MFGGWIIHVWGIFLAFGELSPIPLVLATACFRDMTAGVKTENGPCDPNHAHFKSGWLSEART